MSTPCPVKAGPQLNLLAGTSKDGVFIAIGYIGSIPLAFRKMLIMVLTANYPALTMQSVNLTATRGHCMREDQPTHSLLLGYLLWIFGFIGAHRFYYGKKVTGVIWFFTLGLLFIGWIIDLFLIPAMDREAGRRYIAGPINYNLTWILLTFLGVFGIHRFYMGKIITGIIYLCTGGLLFIGVLYDFLTLNEQLSEINSEY